LTERARAFLPASGIPLLYFGFAHACLGAAFAIVAIHPTIPGPFFLHPRMPFGAGWSDRVAFAAFAAGVAGAVMQFWVGQYSVMAWSALLVVAAVAHLAVRTAMGLGAAVVPWAVKLHVGLAFANMIAASAFGILLGLNRRHVWFAWSPLAPAYAHLHVAAIEWATMMFVGLAYRLIPMIVPTAMPKGSSMAASAALIECGLAVLVVSLLRQSGWTAAGALLIVAGLISFALHIRMARRHRLPPPAALPRPDWTTSC
jgi:hypothetical protein